MNVVAFPKIKRPPSVLTTDVLRCPGSGLIRFHPKVLKELDDILTIGGLYDRIAVTCGCLSQETAELLGGDCAMLHLCDELPYSEKGQLGALALDIRCADDFVKGDLFALAWEYHWSVGWSRDSLVLHLDRRDYVGLPQRSFTF